MARAVNLTQGRLGFAAMLACAVGAVACDWPWRHDMIDQPSRPAAAGPRSPAFGSVSIEAQRKFDRAAGESVSNPLTDGLAAAAAVSDLLSSLPRRSCREILSEDAVTGVA